jgi:hypothetical protein
VLTAPNDGGSLWSPRYLLLAYVPLIVLAADVVAHLSMRRGIAFALPVVLCLGSLWIARAAYRELRGTKQTFGRIVDFVRDRTLETRYVVTDLWWLDQAVASIDDRQFFYTPEMATGSAVVRRFSDNLVPTITVIRSATESRDTSSWNTGTCYFEQRRDTMPVRDLVAIQLRHRCPQ